MSTASLALYFGALDEYLQLEKLQSLLGDARTYTAAHPVTAILGFAAIYVCTTALSIPGAVTPSLFAGALFGVGAGSAVVLFSATTGATLAMLSARYVFSDMVHEKFGERMKTIDAGMEREGGFYLFALRLVPIFPFFVINLAMGLTSIGVWRYVWVSMLGMLPGTVAFVYAGRELGNLHSGTDILNLPMTDAFTVLGLVPLVARKIIDTVRARRAYRGWKKPKRFDRNLIVIGAGAAGLVTSYIAATVRAKVTPIRESADGRRLPQPRLRAVEGAAARGACRCGGRSGAGIRHSRAARHAGFRQGDGACPCRDRGDRTERFGRTLHRPGVLKCCRAKRASFRRGKWK